MSRRKKKNQTLVYFGPSVPGALQQYAIFTNGLPRHVEAKIEEHAILKSLFVPVSKLADTRMNLSIKGTRERNLYLKAKKVLGGKK